MLLEHGADANAKLKKPTLTRAHTPGDPNLGEGATPLMRAAKNGDYRAMEVLLAHGADATLKLKNNGTALMLRMRARPRDRARSLRTSARRPTCSAPRSWRSTTAPT